MKNIKDKNVELKYLFINLKYMKVHLYGKQQKKIAKFIKHLLLNT